MFGNEAEKQAKKLQKYYESIRDALKEELSKPAEPDNEAARSAAYELFHNQAADAGVRDQLLIDKTNGRDNLYFSSGCEIDFNATDGGGHLFKVDGIDGQFIFAHGQPVIFEPFDAQGLQSGPVTSGAAQLLTRLLSAGQAISSSDWSTRFSSPQAAQL